MTENRSRHLQVQQYSLCPNNKKQNRQSLSKEQLMSGRRHWRYLAACILSLTSLPKPEQVACAAVIVNMRNVIAQYQNERRLLLTELRELRRSSKTAVQGSAPAKQDDNDLRRQVMELQSRNAVLQTQNDELMAMLEADKRKISKISSRISILEQELTK